MQLVIYIYTLIDPRTNQIRYVGRTNNPRRRLKHHITNKTCNPHKQNWIACLARDGYIPIMGILEEANESNWQEREQYWISYHRKQGCDLINHTDGGDGTLNPTPEHRMSISASNRTRIVSDEHRAKLSRAHKGKVISAEQRAKLSEMNKQRYNRPEEIAKLSKAQKGRVHPEETRAKMAAKAKERWDKIKPGERKASPETRAKMAAAHKGKVISPEQKIKLSEAHKGKKFTEEHLKHLSEGQQRRRSKG